MNDRTLLEAQILQKEIAVLSKEVNQILRTHQGGTGHALALLQEAQSSLSSLPRCWLAWVKNGCTACSTGSAACFPLIANSTCKPL